MVGKKFNENEWTERNKQCAHTVTQPKWIKLNDSTEINSWLHLALKSTTSELKKMSRKKERKKKRRNFHHVNCGNRVPAPMEFRKYKISNWRWREMFVVWLSLAKLFSMQLKKPFSFDFNWFSGASIHSSPLQIKLRMRKQGNRDKQTCFKNDSSVSKYSFLSRVTNLSIRSEMSTICFHDSSTQNSLDIVLLHLKNRTERRLRKSARKCCKNSRKILSFHWNRSTFINFENDLKPFLYRKRQFHNRHWQRIAKWKTSIKKYEK